jgi:hypothetical protein
MITIYVHGSAAVMPGAIDQLAHLADDDHELVVVASPDHPSARLLAWAAHLPAMPERPAPGSWFITADPATCLDRQSGLRTILIGPRENGLRPTRCDATARDPHDAVLKILASDAMS